MASRQAAAALITGSSLGIYSAWIVAQELRYGQAELRPFVSDIEGPVALYGMNTTLTCWFLIAAAVLWLAADGLLGRVLGRRFRVFAVLQAGLLLCLAIDDRFGFHERLDGVMGIPDALIIGLVGVAELVLLGAYLQEAAPDRRSRQLLGSAALSFAVMVYLDALVASEAVLRLAGEEITKVWGAALLAAWSWHRLRTLVTTDRAPVGQAEVLTGVQR